MSNLKRGGRRAALWLIGLAVIAALAACGGGVQQPQPASTAAPAPLAPTANAPKTSDAAADVAPAPQACALLTVADVEKISGYQGGDATVGPGMEAGDSTCQIVNAQGKLRVTISVNHIPPVVPPTAKTLALEGGGEGVMGDMGLLTQIHFPAYSVALLLMGGTATSGDSAQMIKADGSTVTYAQVYEALARAIAHNAAAGGVNAPAGVIDLSTQGDPCRFLTLDDVKSTLADFSVTGPETRDSAYGGKQCVYQFTNEALKAAGFAALEFITQAKFDANMQNGQALNGIGDAAAFSPSGGLQIRKGSTLLYLTMNIDSNDPKSLDQVGQLRNAVIKQLAQKAVGRIGQ